MLTAAALGAPTAGAGNAGRFGCQHSPVLAWKWVHSDTTNDGTLWLKSATQVGAASEVSPGSRD